MSGILKNKLTKTLLVSLFISAIATRLMVSGFLDTWESKVSDAFYAPSGSLDDIVIIHPGKAPPHDYPDEKNNL